MFTCPSSSRLIICSTNHSIPPLPIPIPSRPNRKMESEITDINSRGPPHHANPGTLITVLGERGLNSGTRLPCAQSEGVRRSLPDRVEVAIAPRLPPPHSCSASSTIPNPLAGLRGVAMGTGAEGSSRLPTTVQPRNKRIYTVLSRRAMVPALGAQCPLLTFNFSSTGKISGYFGAQPLSNGLHLPFAQSCCCCPGVSATPL